MSDKQTFPLNPAVKKMPFLGMSDKQTSLLKPAVKKILLTFYKKLDAIHGMSENNRNG